MLKKKTALTQKAHFPKKSSNPSSAMLEPTLETTLNQIKVYLIQEKKYKPLQVRSVEITDTLPLMSTIEVINHFIKLLQTTDQEMHFREKLKNLLQSEFRIASPFQTSFTTKGNETTQILTWNPGYLVAAMLSFQTQTFKAFLALQDKLKVPKSDQQIFFTSQIHQDCHVPTLAQLLINVFALKPTGKKFQPMLSLLNEEIILARNFIQDEPPFKPSTFDIINTATTINPKQKLQLIKQLLSKVDQGKLPNIIAKKLIRQLMSPTYCTDLESRDVLILDIIQLSDSPYMLLSIALNADPKSTTPFMSETSPAFLKTFTKWLNENPKKLSLPEIRCLLDKSKALCENILEIDQNYKKIKPKSKSKSKSKSRPKPGVNKVEASPLNYLIKLAETILKYHNRDIDLDSTTEENPTETPYIEAIRHKIFALLKKPAQLTFQEISAEIQEKIHAALEKINIKRDSFFSNQIVTHMVLYGSSTTQKIDTDLDLMLPSHVFTYLLKNFSDNSQNNGIHLLNISSVEHQVKSFSVAVRLSQDHVQIFDFCIAPNNPSEQIPAISDISQDSNAVSIQHHIWMNDPKNLMRLLKIYRDNYFSVETSEEKEAFQDELERIIKHNILLNELNNTYMPEHYVTKVMVSTDCSSPTQFNTFKVALHALFDSQRQIFQKPILGTEIELNVFKDLVFNTETTPPSPEKLTNLLQVVSHPIILSIIMHRLFPAAVAV